ncbi:MAG: DMT family transporter [Kiritimatiellae bacterium]|nr:DMT family transporter [Kiritimatiellia bacterium]
MSWTCWMLASAFFLALYDLAKKASVRENAVLPVLLCSTSFGCAAFVLAVAWHGDVAAMFHVDGELLLLALSKSVIVATSWVFTFCALRTLPITIATPIRASAPAMVFLLALVLYGEVPGWLQALGMAVTFAGYWAFSWAGRHEGIDFFRNRAVWCAIAGACCSAGSSLWDKFCFQVRAAPVEAVQFWFQIGLVAVYGTILVGSRLAGWRRNRFEWRWSIPLVGILLAAADWLYFTGLATPEVPISVASLMRRFSVVITFVLGALFFRETNLRRKGFALALVLAGIALLCLA